MRGKYDCRALNGEINVRFLAFNAANTVCPLVMQRISNGD
jgi:hypothetical protein